MNIDDDLAITCSVLVTVYNREQYLAATLDSILASSLKDFEIVVVDDQSSDGSVVIAEKYANIHPQIRFYRNVKNLGDYGNRMRAANLARGKYIKYVDSDDLIYPHSLEIMIEAMESNPDVSLGLSYRLPQLDKPYPVRLTPRESWLHQFLGKSRMGCGPSGSIISRASFFQVGGLNDWDVLSDIDLWIRMSAQSPILLLPPGLVWWRRHVGQEFTKPGSFETYLLDGYRLGLNSLNQNFNPLTKEETVLAREKLRRRFARKILSHAIKERKCLLALRLILNSDLRAIDFFRGVIGYGNYAKYAPQP